MKIKLTFLCSIFYIGIYICWTVNSFGAQFLCNHIPGLTPKQRLICETAPDAIAVIGEGSKLGITECQHQFQFSRWNCTPIGAHNHNFAHEVSVGSREAAFLYAVSSAGVTYAITQACGRGNISSCGCAPPTTISSAALTSEEFQNGVNSDWGGGWKWGGCSADVDFAIRLSRKFMDSRETERDARSLMNLHNNKAGRKAIQSTLETECKCHGVSGSCTLKTCWVKLPSFRKIGERLLEKYQKARPVVAVEGTGTSIKNPRSRRSLMLLVRPKSLLPPHKAPRHKNSKHRKELKETRKRRKIIQKLPPITSSFEEHPKRHELVYLEQSPNYCETDRERDSLGTRGRQCFKNRMIEEGGRWNRTLLGSEFSCDILCCGRGYSTHQMYREWKCNCKFHWCCQVHCESCEEVVEVYTCN